MKRGVTLNRAKWLVEPGCVVLVTGAASGIGQACVDAFLKRGAAVVGLDRSAAIETLWKRPDFLGFVCELTQEEEITQAIDKTVKHFGGVDMLVLRELTVLGTPYPLSDAGCRDDSGRSGRRCAR